VSWDKRFGDPIVVPETVDHAPRRREIHHQTSKAEHDADEWQAAMEELLLVAELDGPPLFARIGIMRALNPHVARVFNASRKDKHWGPRKLARDRRPFRVRSPPAMMP
jgi:hypothetical protein